MATRNNKGSQTKATGRDRTRRYVSDAAAKSFEPFAAEVPPTMGTVFGFLRADNSWHGHRPFAGERKVVQIAWVTNAEELERKKSRNKMAQFFKGIFGR